MDSLIGRLNHVGYIIPQARHFLSRLRRLRDRTKNRRDTHIAKVCADDMDLWDAFLIQAHNGINMNLLTYRKPMHVY